MVEISTLWESFFLDIFSQMLKFRIKTFKENVLLFLGFDNSKYTWQISVEHLQILLVHGPALAPVTSKYVQFSADELPHPTETETD